MKHLSAVPEYTEKEIPVHFGPVAKHCVLVNVRVELEMVAVSFQALLHSKHLKGCWGSREMQLLTSITLSLKNI